MVFTRCLCVFSKNIIGHFGQQIFFYDIKRNFLVSKGPGNECSKADTFWEQMFHGTNSPWNISSQDYSFP